MIRRIVLPGTVAVWTIVLIILQGEGLKVNSGAVYSVVWILGMACIISTGLYLNEKQFRPREFRDIELVDDLTGLNNRRAFFPIARQQMEWGERFAEKALLIFVRLNDLGEITEKFGIEERDFALIMVAQALLSSFRGSDNVARYAEDEFIAFLPRSDLGFREMISRRIRKGVETANKKIALDYRLNIDIGISEFDPIAPASLENLIREAELPPPVQNPAD